MALARSCMRPVANFLAAVAILMAPSGLWAQDDPPKVELFVGYSYLTDIGEDAVRLPLGSSTPISTSGGARSK